jgi:hypothetical protein
VVGQVVFHKICVFKLLTDFADRNEIKYLNGAVFNGLTKLREAFLQDNPCTNLAFKFPNTQSVQQQQSVQQSVQNGVNKRCKSKEMETKPLKKIPIKITTEMTMTTHEMTTTAATFTNLPDNVKSVAIVVSAVIIVLVCIIILVYFFLKGHGKKNQTSPANIPTGSTN